MHIDENFNELIKPKFLAGDEKRFGEFISKLNDKEKLAIISHNDLDGIVSAKILNETFDANEVIFISYGDLNDDFVSNLKKSGFKKIIFSDLSFKDMNFIKEIGKFADILFIDHHLFEEDINSDSIFFIKSYNYCAAYLCFYLCSKIKNLDKFDWLVACACISDYAIINVEKWINKVYEKYGDSFLIQDEYVKKSGKFWDLQWALSLSLIYHKKEVKKVFDEIKKDFGDIGQLKKCSEEVDKEINLSKEYFYKNKEEIKDGYMIIFKNKFSISSILSSIISSEIKNKNLVFGILRDGVYHFSARRQDGKVNVAELLENAVEGFKNSGAGGHFKAAGCFFPENYLEDFKKQLKFL